MDTDAENIVLNLAAAMARRTMIGGGRASKGRPAVEGRPGWHVVRPSSILMRCAFCMSEEDCLDDCPWFDVERFVLHHDEIDAEIVTFKDNAGISPRKSDTREWPPFFRRRSWNRTIDPTVKTHFPKRIGSPPFSYRDGVPVPRNGGVVVGADVEIMPFASIVRGTERDTTIGDGCKIDAFVHVAHDVILGKRCILAAGTIVGGWCEIGDDAYLGINCAIKPRVRIGAGAKIGMGAVVTKDVPAGQVWIGNPARFMRNR